jgi:carboxypeptidase C (cathepsin A)
MEARMSFAYRSFAAAVLLFSVFLVANPASAQQAALGKYTTKAALMPIGESPEAPTAELFYMAYTLDGADAGRRPITFCFNGGPGAASVYLHMAAIGPLVLEVGADGSFPSVPARLVPNPHTWLQFTDLVFIDPVQTGFSRALPGANGAAADPGPYFEAEADLRSIAQFIRRYLTENNRWLSPKAIAGESYGGLRVAALSRLLMEEYDININRAVLISPLLKTTLPPADSRYNLVSSMAMLPSLAAIAAAHGRGSLPADPAKLPQALGEVEQYALGEFVSGLARLGRMAPAEVDAFYARVGGLIGLDPKLVRQQHGRISPEVFVKNLLRDRNLILDRYDGRQASDDPLPERAEFAALDRTLTVLNGVLSGPFFDYLGRTVGYRNERRYIMLNLAANARWNRSSPMGSAEDLGYALTLNTDLKALVVHGYHDLSTPYFMSRYLLEQSVYGDNARQRLSFGVYPGGHMFYLNPASRAELFKDVAGFYR